MTNQNKSELQEAVKAIYDAWSIEGISPSFHRAMKTKLAFTWPALHRAIRNLIKVYEK